MGFAGAALCQVIGIQQSSVTGCAQNPAASSDTAAAQSNQSASDVDGGTGPGARDYKDGAANLNPVSHPTSQYQYDYYRDSSDNQVSTVTSLSNVTVGKTTFTLRRESVTAHGPQGDEASEATVVSGYEKPWKWLLVGGGIGVIRTEDGSSSLAGSLTSTLDLRNMSITIGAARGLLEANAQTISNHIMQTDLSFSMWDGLGDHLGTDVEFHHRMFSDGNSENDLSIAPEYSIKVLKTKLAVGWTLEYADFAQPTKLGYYAPQGLLSNQPAVTWKFDRGGFYGMVKVGLMRTFWLYQSQWMPSFSGSAAAAFGRRLSERTAAEWYLTAGRDSLGMPAAWSSMNTGLKLNYNF